MLAERIDAWRKVYEAKLAEAIARHPTQYWKKDAKEITYKCHETLMTRGLRAIAIDAAGWKSAAKYFGINNTYTAWENWFDGKLTPKPIDGGSFQPPAPARTIPLAVLEEIHKIDDRE